MGKLKRRKHQLLKREGKARETRRTCSECYRNYSKLYGSVIAKNKALKVTTYCKGCPRERSFCMTCYNNFHSF